MDGPHCRTTPIKRLNLESFSKIEHAAKSLASHPKKERLINQVGDVKILRLDRSHPRIRHSIKQLLKSQN